jgi:hypothetical protein
MGSSLPHVLPPFFVPTQVFAPETLLYPQSGQLTLSIGFFGAEAAHLYSSERFQTEKRWWVISSSLSLDLECLLILRWLSTSALSAFVLCSYCSFEPSSLGKFVHLFCFEEWLFHPTSCHLCNIAAAKRGDCCDD